jgi:hemerythrin-like domain-containing protein
LSKHRTRPRSSSEQFECEKSSSEREVISKERIKEPLLALQREHESILRECKVMVAALKNDSANSEGEVTPSSAVKVRALSKLLVDHQSREEQILTPIIAKMLGAEAIASTRVEHKQIIGLLKTLEEDAPPHRTANGPRSDALIDLAVEAESLLHEHFSREENVLFWFASLQTSSD